MISVVLKKVLQVEVQAFGECVTGRGRNVWRRHWS